MTITKKVDKKNPVSFEEFNLILNEWFLKTNFGDRIGDTSRRGQTAWIFIAHDNNLYHLNADTKYTGVKSYLEIMNSDSGMEWHRCFSRYCYWPKYW